MKRKRLSALYRIFGSDSDEEDENENEDKRRKDVVEVEEEEEKNNESMNGELNTPKGISSEVWRCLPVEVREEWQRDNQTHLTIEKSDSHERIKNEYKEGNELPSQQHANNRAIDGYRGKRDPLTGWVMQPNEVNTIAFADSNRPSSWINMNVPFIYIHNRSAYQSFPEDSRHYVGKWLWFVDRNEVDDKFVHIACSLEAGNLGEAAKVPPPENEKDKPSVLIVYTCDYRDMRDVLRVGLELRRLGAKGTLTYKPDVFTLSNLQTCYRAIYHLKKNEHELFKVDDGKALKIALDMSRKSISGELF